MKKINDEEEYNEEENNGFIFTIIKTLFLIILSPLFLTATAYYALLRFARQKFTVITTIAITLNTLIFILFTKTPLQNTLTPLPKTTSIITIFLLTCFTLGSILGLIMVGWESYQIKTNPHRTQLAGSWSYNFKYRLSPLQLLHRQHNINKLKKGTLHRDNRAPLGIEEKSTHPTYRYDSESKRHTLIVGASGSGKALHKNTLIPTPNGPQPIKNLNPNDTIYDENGQETTITGKHNPLTHTTYTITLDYNQQIHTCDDHQWIVNTKNGTQQLNTQQLHQKIQNKEKITIPLTKPIQYTTTINHDAHHDALQYIQQTQQQKHTQSEHTLEKWKQTHPHKKTELFHIIISKLAYTKNNTHHLPPSPNLTQIARELGYKAQTTKTHTLITKTPHQITNITQTQNNNPKDYYCIEVNNPNHLYLCTESYIPTHNTSTMLNLMLSDIKAQKPIIVIDMKKSPEFATKLAAWSAEYDVDFYHFSNGDPQNYNIKHSPGQAHYDPLASGSKQSKPDMILGMREYNTDSAVYKAGMAQLLNVLFAMLHEADRTKAPSIDWNSGGIYQLTSALRPGALLELANACIGTPIEREAAELYTQTKGKTSISHAIGELSGQMRTIAASEYGRWLKTGKEYKNISLFEQTKNKPIVILFSLNSDSEPEFAKNMGSMIMADITNMSAKRRDIPEDERNHVNVYIDEFQTINPSSVQSLLEKARGSNLAITLAQQSFEQIVAASERNGQAYLLSILDTCSNFIIHAGMQSDSAERLSKILGEKWVDTYKATNKHSGFFFSWNWSNRRNKLIQTGKEKRWVVDPQEFMSLSIPTDSNNYKSTAVVINKSISDPRLKKIHGGLARTVWMIPETKVIQDYYVGENTIITPPTPQKEEEETPDDFNHSIMQAEERYEGYQEEQDGGFTFEEDPTIQEDFTSINSDYDETELEGSFELDEEDPIVNEFKESSFTQLTKTHTTKTTTPTNNNNNSDDDEDDLEELPDL